MIMMCFISHKYPLFVFLVALCFVKFTDTQVHRERGISLLPGTSMLVRDLLTSSQLQSIRRRWIAQGLRRTELDTLLNSIASDFVRDHRQTTPRRQSARRRDPLRPTGGHDHHGHDHGDGGQNRNRIDRRDRNRGREGRRNDRNREGRRNDRNREGRRNDRNREGRREGRGNRRNDRVGGSNNGILEERIPDAELRELMAGRGNRGQHNDLPGISNRGNRRQNRHDTHGNIHGHGHGHGHSHGGIGTSLTNRRRGGIVDLDGIHRRTGLERLRARTGHPVVHQPPAPIRNQRRRRKFARTLGRVVGSLLG
ncbi:U1 small nuclear ribonucleoprotein 70 kDa-like [Argopecten irradians]|uniref:U1 small nuclear ribonucleoprotein 70 kDa-like n=1 Tax=Argopecten irradians TaxID=31199 RepID=UPI00371CDF02